MDSSIILEKIRKATDRKDLPSKKIVEIIRNIIDKYKKLEHDKYIENTKNKISLDKINDEIHKWVVGFDSDVDNFTIKIFNKNCVFNYITNIFDEAIITKKYIKSLSPKFVNLRQLAVRHQSIETIPDTLVNLVKLDIRNSHFSHIPETLVNLEILDIAGNNKIKHISPNFTKLIILDCSSTEISEIPDTLVNLESLTMYETRIRFLPHTLAKLYYLNTNFTKFLYIPDEFKNLRKILCGNLFINTNRQDNYVEVSKYVSYYYDEFPKERQHIHEYFNINISALILLYKTFTNWQKMIKYKLTRRRILKLLYEPKYIGGYLAKIEIMKNFTKGKDEVIQV